MILYELEYWEARPCRWRLWEINRDGKGRPLHLGLEDPDGGIPLSITLAGDLPAAMWEYSYLNKYRNPPAVIQVYRMPKGVTEEALMAINWRSFGVSRGGGAESANIAVTAVDLGTNGPRICLAQRDWPSLFLSAIEAKDLRARLDHAIGKVTQWPPVGPLTVKREGMTVIADRRLKEDPRRLVSYVNQVEWDWLLKEASRLDSPLFGKCGIDAEGRMFWCGAEIRKVESIKEGQ